jgi:hypothetical protein
VERNYLSLRTNNHCKNAPDAQPTEYRNPATVSAPLRAMPQEAFVLGSGHCPVEIEIQ